MPEASYSRQDILYEIAAVLQRECRINRPSFREQDRLIEDLGLESMGLLVLASQVENNLQIILGEDPLSPPKTIGDVIDLIGVQLNGKNHR